MQFAWRFWRWILNEHMSFKFIWYRRYWRRRRSVLSNFRNAHLLAFYFAGTGGFGNEIFCLRVNKHIFFYILEKKYIFSKYTVPEVFIIINTVNSRETPLIALSYIFPNAHGLYNSNLAFYGLFLGTSFGTKLFCSLHY